MGLKADFEQRLKRATSRLVPDGPAVPGYKLTVTGLSPFSYGWQQDDDKEILRGIGDPNGVVTAHKGDLYVERDAPALWQNDDGLSSWILAGSGAVATFPISYDDGTYTYEITAVGGTLTFAVTENADPMNSSFIELDSLYARLSALFGVTIENNDNSDTVDIKSENIVFIKGDEGVEIHGGGAGTQIYIGDTADDVHVNSNQTTFAGNAVIPDAALANGTYGFWLDDTPGATVLNIKAKDSIGTVRTGSIALT